MIRPSVRAMTVLTILIAVASPSLAEDPTAGKQVEQSFETGDDASVPYLLYLPKNYDEADDQKHPVMLFLHGRGESNGPLSLVGKWGPPRMAAEGKELKYILVSPQCPRADFWSSEDATGPRCSAPEAHPQRVPMRRRSCVPHRSQYGWIWLVANGGRSSRYVCRRRPRVWRW